MNVMSDQLRGQVTYAGWMELCAEMVKGSGRSSFDFPADGGMSMESFLQQCAAQNTDAVCDANGRMDYAAMCESYAQQNPDFQIIYKAYQQDASFRNTQILDVSFENGAITTCRIEDGQKSFYVSFAGTLGSHDEWNTNADVVLGESQHQRAAANYFDTMYLKHMAGEENAWITVDGHSNGGNKAGYTMQMSQYRGHIDQCVNFDGEGYSDSTWAEMQSHGDHQAQLDKTVFIRGENDPISGASTDLPAKNQYFLTGNYQIFDLNKTHGMRYLFVNSEGNFSTMLQDECGQGEFSRFVEVLYKQLESDLSKEDFALVVRTFMAAMQDDGTVGLPELINALTVCTDSLNEVFFNTPEGEALRNELSRLLLTPEQMQGLGGTGLMILIWMLSIPSDNIAYQLLKEALKYLTNVDLTLLNDLLDGVAKYGNLIGSRIDDAQYFLWENFGLGDSPYTTSASSAAGQYTEMYVDTDDLREIASELQRIADEIQWAGFRTSRAIETVNDDRSLVGQALGELGDHLTRVKARADIIRDRTKTASDNLCILKKALQEMAELLEQAEADARLNAR